jgi:hypothetical protein
MTQKEIINEIREEQKRMAQEQLKLSVNISNFMNKQDLFNQKIDDILQTNPLTKRKGIIEDLEELKPRVDSLELKNKVTAGKIAVSIAIFATIGSILLKILGFFDK